MTGKTLYDHWRDVPSEAWHWPSFSPEEIACRGTGKLLVDPRAMDMLQALRDRIGKPMIVNSGYRSPEHNRAVGGAARSKHMEGIAFDVRMDNHDPQAFMAAAREIGFKGIGEYPDLGFTHIDARETPAHWAGSTGRYWPTRSVNDRFAPEVQPTPVADAAKQGAGIVVAVTAAEGVLTDVADKAAPIFPAEWISYLLIAVAVLGVARVLLPLVLKPQEDEQA